ncbi:MULTISPECIES: hypothetical protein [unclassified Streptomyces]|uniref:hypothetical protein n=1 Tax=unclassified Streptomyces TaxID=2593676 RepID=UPI0006AF57CA|nr:MULTISPECIES: hypothetical protein [unclassified Streptomyces]KOX31631.1 hypothetical protein ADL06_11065 [Streptomyces sp. NRRL F-6491]KOX48030.1 hypothetical protein ADL08_11165 [Streptomyces sp. NRRL F-6492]
MSIALLRVSIFSTPVVVAALAVGTLSAPQAVAADRTITVNCSAALGPSADGNVRTVNYYVAKTSTTWKHKQRQNFPTSHGINKSRRDLSHVTYLLDGTTRRGHLEVKKNEVAWNNNSWGVYWSAGREPVTKKGSTRLVSHGWYNMNSWPIECKGKSFAF